MTTVLLVGATGLVGQSVLQLAQSDARVAWVIAPTRRALPVHPKLFNPLVNFDHLPEDADCWAVDAVICTLGSTIKVAGSQAAFYWVDHDLPLKVGELLPDLGEMLSRQGVDLGAGQMRVFRQMQKAADFVEAEPQSAATGDEANAGDVALSVRPVPRRRSLRLREQADLLVVADGLEVAARGCRQFSDLHGLDPVATPGFTVRPSGGQDHDRLLLPRNRDRLRDLE